MKEVTFIIFAYILCCSNVLNGQTVNLTESNLQAVNVSFGRTQLMGKHVIRVVKDSNVIKVDEPTFVKLPKIDFENGSIEVRVLSRFLPNAPDLARGFIGLAFRINEINSQFESIYIRPDNARANDQLRRNHSIQYFSYPDYKFDRLRKEAEGRYEAYTDMGMNEWIKLKIVVHGQQAKLFINGNKQPSLIVNDLKHGANRSGSIGLWVDVGTEGFFTDMKIEKEK